MNVGLASAVFETLTTPVVADACVRLKVPLRVAPSGIRAVGRLSKLGGPVCPVRHYGSVDIFLEACEVARRGDVLVIDNQGRTDEGCIGDLTVLEVQAAGLAGMVVHGMHRDTVELEEIGFPVFTYGKMPAGPMRLDEREPQALTSARFGEFEVTAADHVFADADGVLFVPTDRVAELIDVAAGIQQTERRQAADIKQGSTLRQQLRFAEYLERREADAKYSFREHLRTIGGAIEE